MAHFRATIQGQRGQASRLGSKNSGICTNCNGWTAGVSVEAGPTTGDDYFEVFMTSGSNPSRAQWFLGRVVVTPSGPRWDPAAIEPPRLAPTTD